MTKAKQFGLLFGLVILLGLVAIGLFPGELQAALPTRHFNNIQANGYVVADGQEDAVQVRVQGYTTQTNNLLTLETSAGTDVFTVDNSGNVDTAGTVNFGADNLYPLGYASANQQIVCGTTTFTATSEVEATGLTTVTYVLASQTTTPASTGALLTVSDPTTSTFILSSWEADYSEGTTGVTAHWCAVGDQ